MFKSQRKRRILTELFRYTLMALIAVVMLVPWPGFSSLRFASWQRFPVPQPQLAHLLPGRARKITATCLARAAFPHHLQHCLCLLATVLGTLVNSIAGFAFAFRFKGKICYPGRFVTFMMP